MLTTFRVPILLLLTLSSMESGAAATARQTEAELASIRERIERVSRELGADAMARDHLSAGLREAELAATGARQQLFRLSAEQTERRQQRTALARERDGVQSRLSAERTALAAQLRVAYMVGSTEPLKLLLGQRDPLHASRLLAYYGYFGRARAEQIEGISARIARIDAIDVELTAAEKRLGEIRSEQQSRLADLDKQRGERQQVLAALQRESQTRAQTLARLRAQQGNLEKLLRELARAVSSTPPPDTGTEFGHLRGRLEWPVAGRLVAEYGQQRAAGVKWEGMVLATERAAPVRAVSAGRVVYADWLPGLGLLSIVDHGEGYLSLYGYNDELRKAVGEIVNAGDVIAAAGDTGGRSRPELYFEIRRAGKPVDPQPWFRNRRP
jgi:murein hydrolase activator